MWGNQWAAGRKCGPERAVCGLAKPAILNGWGVAMIRQHLFAVCLLPMALFHVRLLS
jgi:hypothetical protein